MQPIVRASHQQNKVLVLETDAHKSVDAVAVCVSRMAPLCEKDLLDSHISDTDVPGSLGDLVSLYQDMNLSLEDWDHKAADFAASTECVSITLPYIALVTRDS